jgi:hypothetical protein
MLRFEFRLTLHVVDFMLFLVSGINCPDIGKYRHSSVDRHRRHADRGAANKKDSVSFEGLTEMTCMTALSRGALQNSDNCCLDIKLPLFYI